MTSEPELQGVPLLVVASKRDLPTIMSMNEIKEQLKLESIKDREWSILPLFISTNGTSMGIPEILDWVTSTVQKKVRFLSS